MKKLILIMLLVGVSLCARTTQAEEVKGNLTEIKGIPVLQTWGTHYERGYAYGNLLAKQIDVVLMDYFVKGIVGNSYAYYSSFFKNLENVLTVDQKYLDEAQGIADGFNATPHSQRFREFAGRDVEALDFVFTNSIVELLSTFGCSSIMSWGDATIDDPELQGELVITRHLDWQKVPELYENHIVIAANPSEEDEQKWISFGFPGLFGCLSGVNESSLVAFQHMGNDPQGSIFGKKVEPIFFAIRNALEMKDYNKDGKCNTSDVFDAIGKKTTGGGFIVDAAGAVAHGDSAIVIETNLDNGTVSRILGENSNVSGTNLVATNHFRKLAAPTPCVRYDALQAALIQNDKMSIGRSWEVLKDAAGLSNNLQTIEVVPSENKILLSFSTADESSFDIKATEFLFEDFFKTSGIEDTEGELVFSLKAYPNPVVNSLNMTLQTDNNQEIEISLCDLNGNKVATVFEGNSYDANELSFDMSSFAKGMYLLQVRTPKTTQAVKIVK